MEHGADPRLLDPDGGGPLFSPLIAWDAVVLKLLLDAGADPNDENEPGETLFEWAKVDYVFEVWNCGMQFPEEPTEADKASPDTWLDFLDRIALKYGKRRPEIPRLLRERGAQTSTERRQLGLGEDGPSSPDENRLGMLRLQDG